MDLLKEIKALLKEKNVNNPKTTTTFKEMGLDSLDAMDLIVKLETKINKRISDDQLMKIKNIDDLIRTIEKIN